MLKSLKDKFYFGLLLFVLLFLAVVVAILGFDLSEKYSFLTAGVLMLTYIFIQVFNHFKRPKKHVQISTKVELTAPPRILKRVRNYRLKVTTIKHIEDKGIERSVQMDELLMSFNDKDHPDAYAYCLLVIRNHMKICIETARKSHPDAEIVASPLQLPPDIQRLEQ
ncbi:MAG: hypothetical protein HKN45_00915 [Flavobacteriales bacterium]|nr:hypothetical protein [Flavobacteriales bacterium]